METRTEQDLLGARQVPAEALWGVSGLRAQENFPLSGRPCHPALIRAYGLVKQACAQVNAALGVWRDDPAKEQAILAACRGLAAGQDLEQVVGDALQGGAGTSLNMVVNEVLANRALQALGEPLGAYHRVSPGDDLNRHQSTNDTYPTALRLAAIRGLQALEQAVLGLQEAFQDRERAFAHLVKVGRTQLQDAVLTTLGREMGAYAEALSRDRWRIFKAVERLRVVNLGGTAIGSGLGAPREFIFRATDTLRELSGLPLARADNLVEATQNADVWVESSGFLKALAVTLRKSANDLRLLASGPEAGLGELRLPALQAGSSIMPGKVNPVLPEAVIQVSWVVEGNDLIISQAAGAGTLELNPFLPVIADRLLESLDLLTAVCRLYRERCVLGLEADAERLAAQVEGSTAAATALVPRLGYEAVCALVLRARAAGLSVREQTIRDGLLTEAEYRAAISPEAVTRLGS
ncbi:MAG: aspartate ammonia-lyase [Candidatus Delongbacteria bacterium]